MSVRALNIDCELVIIAICITTYASLNPLYMKVPKDILSLNYDSIAFRHCLLAWFHLQAQALYAFLAALQC